MGVFIDGDIEDSSEEEIKNSAKILVVVFGLLRPMSLFSHSLVQRITIEAL